MLYQKENDQTERIIMSKNKKANSRKRAAQMAAAKKKKKVIMAVTGLAVVAVAAGGIFWWQQHKSVGDKLDYDPVQYVTIGEYKGVQVSLEVTDEDLQDEIDNIREENATYQQLAGTTQTGQTIRASFEGYVDGQKMDATCGEDYVELGSGDWLDGFEENLTGVQTGNSVVFTVAVPEGTYDDPTIDGKNVEFHATVLYICGEENLPEYSDDFVKSISKKYKTTEEYNNYLREKLHKENEEQKAEYAWSDVLETCEAKKYPKSLLEASKKEVLQGYYDMAAVYNCSKEEIFPMFGYTDEAEFTKTDMTPLAKDTAKEYLASEAIAQKEDISYTEEEFEKYVKTQYEDMSDEYDSAKEYEKANKEYLQRQLLLEKVKTWIADHAKYSG